MIVEIKKICVATDFSPEGEHALKYGVALAEHHGAELHLLHVVQDYEKLVAHPDFTAGNAAAGEFFKQMEQEANDQMGALGRGEDAPWWSRLTVERIVRRGTPHLEICNYAKNQNIDLVVVGTHGHSGLKHMMLGSVAERVARSCPCPVLVVRPKDRDFIHTDPPGVFNPD